MQTPAGPKAAKGEKPSLCSVLERLEAEKENWDPSNKVFSTDRKRRKSSETGGLTNTTVTTNEGRKPLKDITKVYNKEANRKNTNSILMMR